ncbi:MAG: Polyribonucleotide nucleotidyltransferase [Anaerolineales bacterium]|nr:Polyribonucleotide nucleotidyltransferase [Anaerolineales bacterium]
MTTLDIAPAAAIEPKTKLSGKVLKITLAGALVDIGQSVPGVLHISQISESSVNKVEDVLKEGQEVTVWVKRVRNDRVELTMVEPLAYDWKELKPDMVVKGKVTRIETYGAFVDFGAERPGLIHVSELAHGFVKTAGAVVKQGDEVEAKVLEVDRRKRQIRLSVKALQEAIAAEEAPEPVERKPKGKRKGGKKSEESYEMEQETSNEPEFTAMQVAWQQALEKANGKTKIRAKSIKTTSQEQEDLFSSTLEKRLPTGG